MGYRIAVVGATGNVGREMLNILAEREFPVDQIVALASRRPRMWGFQAAGAAPIVLGHPVSHPETIATAIRIGNPASWRQAEAARDESGGLIDAKLQFQAAIDCFERMRQVDPNAGTVTEADSHEHLGDVHRSLGELDLAAASWRIAAARYRDHHRFAAANRVEEKLTDLT